MLVPTLVMGAIALLLLAVGFGQGQGAHVTGLRSALTMSVTVLPLLLFAFIVAGMVQALIPQETIARWVGNEAGMRGIWIGSLAGGLTPGGPHVSMPIAAALMKAGAGVGTMVAFLTGWSLLAFARMPMEVGLLGWRLALIRLACTFFFPPIAGLIAHWLFR